MTTRATTIIKESTGELRTLVGTTAVTLVLVVAAALWFLWPAAAVPAGKVTPVADQAAITASAAEAARVSHQQTGSAFAARRLAERTVTVYLVASEAERERLLANLDAVINAHGGQSHRHTIIVVQTPAEEAAVWRWVVDDSTMQQGTDGPSVRVIDLRAVE